MSDASNRPIIIKRKKVVAGDGHHGGAWKVAYADFVTAMMAFFMLMWLLNATTEKQRKGLADYFSPTIAVARTSGGGSGAFNGDSLFTSQSLAQSGIGGVTELDAQTSSQAARDEGAAAAEQQMLEEMQLGLLGRGGDSLVAEMALKHVVTHLTDEGLVVEVFDLEGSPLFAEDTSEATEVLRQILAVVADTFSVSSNPVAVAAFSRSYPVVLRDNPAWSLTVERAQRARQLLEGAGLAGTKMKRVTGYGQQEPLFNDPMAVRNNRLEIVLLRQQGRFNR